MWSTRDSCLIAIISPLFQHSRTDTALCRPRCVLLPLPSPPCLFAVCAIVISGGDDEYTTIATSFSASFESYTPHTNDDLTSFVLIAVTNIKKTLQLLDLDECTGPRADGAGLTEVSIPLLSILMECLIGHATTRSTTTNDKKDVDGSSTNGDDGKQEKEADDEDSSSAVTASLILCRMFEYAFIHSPTMRQIGKYEYSSTCSRCHSLIMTVLVRMITCALTKLPALFISFIAN